MKFKNQRRKPTDLHILALSWDLLARSAQLIQSQMELSPKPTSHLTQDERLCIGQHSSSCSWTNITKHTHFHTPGNTFQCFFQLTYIGGKFFSKLR